MSKRWIVLFSAGSIAMTAMLGLVIWLIAGSVEMGSANEPTLGFNAMAAMAIGLVLTTGLGVGLMALVFYSARSGADDGSAVDTHEPGTTPQR